MAFGEFEVLAGDFKKGRRHHVARKKLLMRRSWRLWKPWRLFRERVKFTSIEAIEEASDESVKRLGGTVGWGVAGATLLGPVGLLAGLLGGGKGTDVTFVCKLRDGRKFLATAKAKDYKKILAGAF